MQDIDDQFDEASVRAELDRVLDSSEFAGSERHRRFLTYIVEETLAGRGDRLKAYNIATAAFNRGEDFEPTDVTTRSRSSSQREPTFRNSGRPARWRRWMCRSLHGLIPLLPGDARRASS